MKSRVSLSQTERKLYSKLRTLLNEPGLIRGSLVEMKRVCGKKSCHCATDPERKHRSLYLGLRIDGKNRMIYVPTEWEDRIREWTNRYAEMREVIEQLSLKSLERLKNRQE
jgi:hypothetical protein